MSKTDRKYLRPDSLTSPSRDSIASGYKVQIINDRYLDLQKVKQYMKTKWPEHECKVQVSVIAAQILRSQRSTAVTDIDFQVKLGKFILTIPKVAKDLSDVSLRLTIPLSRLPRIVLTISAV